MSGARISSTSARWSFETSRPSCRAVRGGDRPRRLSGQRRGFRRQRVGDSCARRARAGLRAAGDVPAPLLERTLIFVSTDAGAYGGAGATRFADTSPLAEHAIATIVLDGIGGRGRPRLVISGGRSSSPARTLVSTASARVTEQAGRPPVIPSALSQLVDLGIPYAAGEQAPFLADGVAAITLTTRDPGEPSIPVGDPLGPTSAESLGRLGRAAEAIVGSIDTSVGATFPTRDNLFLGERVASGWTVRLTLVVAVVPFALGVLDLLVRGRRRGLPLLPGIRALRSRLFLWLYGGLLVWVGAVAGVFPTGAALPLPPSSSFVADWHLSGLAVLAVAFALGWLVARGRSSRPSADPRAAARGLYRSARVARRGRRGGGAAEALRARVRLALALRVALASASPTNLVAHRRLSSRVARSSAGSLAARP